jgi:hypothetical protein
MSFIAFALWGAFMMGSIFYTQEARHPDTRPMAAFFVFVAVFSVSAFAAFAMLTLLIQEAGLTESLSNPGVAIAFLLAVFVPAFLAGRWQVRKPPRQQGVPERF